MSKDYYYKDNLKTLPIAVEVRRAIGSVWQEESELDGAGLRGRLLSADLHLFGDHRYQDGSARVRYGSGLVQRPSETYDP